MKTEAEPLDPEDGTLAHAGRLAIGHIEDVVVARVGPPASAAVRELPFADHLDLVVVAPGSARARTPDANSEMGGAPDRR